MEVLTLNEKRIALLALIVAFLGWVGIKPEHFSWVWDYILVGIIWSWELIKSIFSLIVNIFTFSIKVPVSLIIIISIVCFLAGKFKSNKALENNLKNKEDANSAPSLSVLTERQKLILLDIYNCAGPDKRYDEIIRKLRIDFHMLNQAVDELVRMGYLVNVSDPFGENYPNVSRYGRDSVIQFLESNQQSN